MVEKYFTSSWNLLLPEQKDIENPLSRLQDQSFLLNDLYDKGHSDALWVNDALFENVILVYFQILTLVVSAFFTLLEGQNNIVLIFLQHSG